MDEFETPPGAREASGWCGGGSNGASDPRVAVARLQWSAACPCGNVSAAAECCLPWEEAFWRLAARLAAFAGTDSVRALAGQAAEVFWGTEASGGSPRRRSAGSEACFTEWFLLDYAVPGCSDTLLGEFADGETALGPRETPLLLSLLLAPMRAFEVTEMLGPSGAMMKDLLTGSETAVGPFGLPDGLIRSDICIGRVVSVGRFRRVGLGLLRFRSAGRGELLAYLRAAYGLSRLGRHVSLEDYADGAAHLYHHFFLERGRLLDGRAHRTCRWVPFRAETLRYRCLDPTRIRAALDRQSALEKVGENGGECRFLWRDRVHGVGLGTIVLRGGELDVHTDTVEDLTRLSEFLDSCLRGLVRRIASDIDLVPPSTRHAEVERLKGVAGMPYLQRTLAGWVDTPSPALLGQTPRAACLSPEGRSQVTELLVDLDRSMVRQKRLGKAWADTGALWEELRLSPPSPVQGVSANDAPLPRVRERVRVVRR